MTTLNYNTRENFRDEHSGGANDAHVHEGDWTSPLDLPEEFVRGFFETWAGLEEQIVSYNETKKAMLANCRALYGRYHSEALKLACKLALKEPERLAADDLLTAQAKKYLRVLLGNPQDGASGNA